MSAESEHSKKTFQELRREIDQELDACSRMIASIEAQLDVMKRMFNPPDILPRKTDDA